MNSKVMKMVRQAVADYMQSEGCSCCRDIDAHNENTKRLAELLHVPMYEDESGYNFSIFSTEAQANKARTRRSESGGTLPAVESNSENTSPNVGG